MRSWIQRVGRVGCLCAVALVLSGCGDKDSNPKAPADAPKLQPKSPVGGGPGGAGGVKGKSD
jgi:hypothetical protein